MQAQTDPAYDLEHGGKFARRSAASDLSILNFCKAEDRTDLGTIYRGNLGVLNRRSDSSTQPTSNP